MDYIRAIERQQIREDIPQVRVGDNVKVHYRIKEGDRERVQVFQGDVIRMSGGSSRETFTVRKISFGVGVERTFPLHSPKDRQASGRASRPGVALSFTICATRWARLLAFPRSANSQHRCTSRAVSLQAALFVYDQCFPSESRSDNHKRTNPPVRRRNVSSGGAQSFQGSK